MSTNNEKYYVLTCDEDGINIKEFEDAYKLREHFKKYYNPEEVNTQLLFLDKIPKIDKGYFYFTNGLGENQKPMIIIKGKIIVPKPVKVVREYEIK